MQCPSCNSKFQVTLRESLEPYKFTITLEPDEGRMIEAETIGSTISSMAGLMEAAGDSFGHKTKCQVLSVEVDGDMKTKITMSSVPVLRATTPTEGEQTE